MRGTTPGILNIGNWKDFERFAADLLEAEGFAIEREPFVDRTGADIIAVEEFRSHSERTMHVRWRVQCKNYAASGTNLGRREAEEAIFAYEAVRRSDEGLFLFLATDYTEEAKAVVDAYVTTHSGAKVTLWNRRQILARVERHPHLIARYNLSRIDTSFASTFAELGALGQVRSLIISDQSALAHNVTSGMRAAGFDVTFLPVWNYLDPERLLLAASARQRSDYQLVVVFLGDTFGLPFPEYLQRFILDEHARGATLLLFPFLGWLLGGGHVPSLASLCPVALAPPGKAQTPADLRRIAGSFRSGDFSWLLKGETFAENQYSELDPKDGSPAFTRGISQAFGLSHTFEFLIPQPGAIVEWADTSGNPIVVTRSSGNAKVAYVNTCCHACLTTIAITSPLEASQQATLLIRNVLTWLLEK